VVFSVRPGRKTRARAGASKESVVIARVRRASRAGRAGKASGGGGGLAAKFAATAAAAAAVIAVIAKGREDILQTISIATS
jgi:hypothetical protein